MNCEAMLGRVGGEGQRTEPSMAALMPVPSNLPRGFQRFEFEKLFRPVPAWGFLRFGVRVSLTYG